jgi:hypothetical protein
MKTITPSILALFLSMLIAGNASAFSLIYSGSLQKNLTGWNKTTLTFDIDTSCTAYLSTVQSAISAAADIWNAVPSSSLTIALGSTVTMPQAILTALNNGATAGNPTVYCDTNFGSNFHAINAGTPAATASASIPGYAGGTSFNSSTMNITGEVLVLNVESGVAANITTASATLVNTVLTHEIGHVLGLGHSADTNAMMYYATSAARKTVLNKDDMDGITYLYPRKELSGSGGLMGCNTVRFVGPGLLAGSGKKTKPGGAFEFAILVMAFIAIWGVSRKAESRT